MKHNNKKYSKKSHTKYYIINKTKKNQKLQLEKIPETLNKHLVKYISPNFKDNKDVLIFSLKPYLYKNSIKLGNQINGISDILKMPVLKNKFKDFFTYDYMNYIDMDIEKRKISFSEIKHLFHGHPIILEGYLLITYFKSIFNSYMLDKLKILDVNVDGKNGIEYYFPDNLPDGFPNSYTKSIYSIMEIINQVFTIMKYIAIILSYSNIKKPFNLENAFEIIKVRFKLFSDNSIILDKCIIKKDWFEDNNMNMNSMENKMLCDWLNALVFRPILGGKLSLDLELASISLFSKNYNKKYKEIADILNTKNMTRKDFNNNYVIISSNFLFTQNSDVMYNYFVTNMKKYGLKQSELYSVGTKPALIWYGLDQTPVNYSLIAQHYNTIAYVGNYIGQLNSINDKQLLYFNIKKYFPNEYLNFMPLSFLLTKNTTYNYGYIYIARPINLMAPEAGEKKKAFSGKDIIYITNQTTMNTAIKLLDIYDNILISEYIKKPLLFKGKKFHLRIAFLITYYNSVLKTYLFNDSLFRTAKLPFILDHFDNMDIHDTHFDTTEQEYIFPDDFTTKNIGILISNEIKYKIQKDIIEILKKVSIVLSNNLTEIYSNLKNSFQLEGIDIMITDDFKPILIECNKNPGFAANYNIGIEWQRKFFDFIDRNAISPLFGDGKQKTDEPLYTTKI